VSLHEGFMTDSIAMTPRFKVLQSGEVTAAVVYRPEN
jgi:hypothetical protein